MILPEEYFPLSEAKWLEGIKEQRNKAKSLKDELLGVNPSSLEAKYSDKVKVEYVIAVIVYEYLKYAAFFPDQEAMKKIKELKYKSDVLRWFIPFDDLLNQYAIIRENNIQIDKQFAWTCINSYLGTKIQNEILKYHLTTTHDNVSMTFLTKQLILLRGRRNYSGSDPKRYKNLFELLLNDQVNEFSKIPNEELDLNFQFNIDSFIDISKGKTESNFLRILVEQCFQYDEKVINKTKFLGIIFDLVKLLMPDRNLMDNITFNEAADLTYKSYGSYKAQTLKKIIYPNRKTKKVSSVSGSQSKLT